MNIPERKETAQRALVWVGIALAVVVLLVLLWYGLDVVLLAFLGILLAILLRAPADWLTRRTGIGTGWTLAFVGFTLVALVGAGAFFFGRALQLAESSGVFSGEMQFLGKGLGLIGPGRAHGIRAVYGGSSRAAWWRPRQARR